MNAYSFSAYLRSHAGFALGAVALVAVVAGIMAVTGSNASAIALVSLCEALFACVALAAGFLRDREFYQQLDLFCDSPENARCLSSILDEPRTLEGSIAYRALAVQGKAASDELTARSRDMKEYRNYIELWVHETKTPIASAQLALASLHGPEIGKVRGDLDRIESRVEQALYYARSATLSEDFSIEELHLAALARKACRQRSRTLIGAGVSLEFAIDETLEVLADAKWTDFIIGQVLENSAKYGAKTIRFEGTTKDAGTKDGCIELLIADDGDGIPAADVPRVFDRGFTGSRGRTHHKATGMGAAPSRRGLRKNGPWPAHFLRRGNGHHRRADLPPSTARAWIWRDPSRRPLQTAIRPRTARRRLRRRTLQNRKFAVSPFDGSVFASAASWGYTEPKRKESP